MYLVTDRSRIAIIVEYPLTLDGWNDAVTFGAIMAQAPELYPSGIVVERRNIDGSITQIVNMTSGASNL